jgi:serine/threonine protein kinase/tetratricopeptide (TPR) repeat protein
LDDLQKHLIPFLAGRYELVRELGRGARAIVYLAKDVKHGRHVALKALRPEFAASVGSERFLREIEISAGMAHPHILPLYDSGEAGGALFYVMPFVEGESLRDRIAAEGQLPIAEAVELARQVADALSYAHKRGVIHRDIKPENILLEDGKAVVADFGIARAMSAAGAETLTVMGVAVGTPHYMSPEQASGASEVDERADLYSLACVLYEMLAGSPPFSGSTAQAVMAGHLRVSPPSINDQRASVPSDVAAAIDRALRKAPAERFSTAEEFSKALAGVMTPSQRRFGGSRMMPAAPEDSEPAFGERILRRMREEFWRLTAAGVVIFAIYFVVIWPPIPSLDPTKLVCFPPSRRGAGEIHAQDVSLAASIALESVAPLSCLDGYPFLTQDQRRDTVGLSVSEARSIAIDLRAEHFVLGHYMAEADSLFVTLQLYRTARGEFQRQSTSGGDLRSTSSGQIGVRALLPLLPELLDPGREYEMSFITDRDPAAVALWIQGERFYRGLQFDSAHASLREAVERDSLLAFAALKGAQAASWDHRPEQGDSLVRLAIQHLDLLPTRYRHFAKGLSAFYSGWADSARTHYLRALEVDREWNEAWIGLGEVYHHLLPADMEVPGSAEDAFRNALRLDPGYETPLIHLAEIEISKGDTVRGASLVSRVRSLGPDSTTILQLEWMLACARATLSKEQWATHTLEDPLAVLLAAKNLAVAGSNLACAEGAFSALLAEDPTGALEAYRWGSLIGLSGVLFAQGRNDAAIEALTAGRAAGEGSVPFLYLLGATVIPQLDSLAQEIDGLARRVFGDSLERVGPIEAWALGGWRASRGDSAELHLLAERLSELAREPQAGSRAHTPILARALAAHQYLSAGDTTRAIESLTSLSYPWPYRALSWGLDQVLPYERLLISRLYLKRGDFHQALRVAEQFDHPGPAIFLYFLPQSLAIRFRAAEELGWTESAEGFRERLIGLGRVELLVGDQPTYTQIGGRR